MGGGGSKGRGWMPSHEKVDRVPEGVMILRNVEKTAKVTAQKASLMS